MTVLVVLAILVAWNLLRLSVAWSNLKSSNHLQTAGSMDASTLAICIPARNEAHNLPLLLEDLAQQSLLPQQIIIVDDHSEDETSEIVQAWSARWPVVQLVKGASLPEGWLGKHWACWQASNLVKADRVLFLDADLRLHPEAIKAAMAYAGQHQLALLSLFPTQMMQTKGEQLTVPLVHRILLELLPLSVANRTQWESMSAGNGQFMLFSTADYRKLGGHESVKQERAEDIALVRLFRENRLKTHTLLGNKLVNCRMYASYHQAQQGFAKNIRAMMLNSDVFQLIYWALGLLAYTWLGFENPLLMLIPLGLSWLTHACSAKAAKEPQPWNPLRQGLITLNFFWLSLYAVYTRFTGTTQWKGRRLS